MLMCAFVFLPFYETETESFAMSVSSLYLSLLQLQFTHYFGILGNYFHLILMNISIILIY